MVTVFDLVTGETETFSAKAEPKVRVTQPEQNEPMVLPRLQEHTFTEPQSRDMPLELAQLDCEVFFRAMDKR